MGFEPGSSDTKYKRKNFLLLALGEVILYPSVPFFFFFFFFFLLNFGLRSDFSLVYSVINNVVE